MIRSYFRYLLRSRRTLILFFLAVYLILSLTWMTYDGVSVPGYGFYTSAKMAAALSMGLTFVLPVLVFSPFQKRSGCDQYFSLPISRKEIRIASLLAVFSVIFGYFLITVTAAWLLFGIGYVPLTLLLGIHAFMAFSVLSMCAINSYLFLLGNSWIDGIVILAAYTLLPFAASIGEGLLISNLMAGKHALALETHAQILSPVYTLMANYAALISRNGWLYMKFSLPLFLLSILYTVIGWFGLIHEFDERRSERAEMISDHPLAYPLIIHLYSLLCLLVICSSCISSHDPSFLILLVLLLVCFVLGQFLYRRRLEISWKQAGIFLAETILCLGFCQIMWSSRCFGMADRVRLDEGDTLVYEYSRLADEKDLGRGIIGQEMDHGAYVSFQLEIPTDRLNEYQEVLQILEACRKTAVDQWYERRTHELSGYFQISSKTGDRTFNQYHFNPDLSLSEEELKRISGYCDVVVDDFNHDLEPSEMPLAEFLKLRSTW